MLNHIFINGEKKDFGIESNWKIEDLVKKIYKTYTSESTAIATLRVNGIDITPGNEALLKDNSMTNLEKIELTTVHPSELVQDTLQNILDSIDFLKTLSRRLSEEEANDVFKQGFFGLIEGLQTVFQAMDLVRRVWKVKEIAIITDLENELEAILKKIVHSKQNGLFQDLKTLFSAELPNHLEKWSSAAIPALMRSRDC